MRPQDVALLVAVAALWGFNFVPIRWALDNVPPFALAATRFALAAIPVVFFVRRPRVPIRLVIAYGAAIGVGQFGLLFLAIQLGLAAGLASLLMQVQVFATIALAAFFLGDRASLPQLGGAALAAVGIATLVGGRLDEGAPVTLLGLLLVLGSALSWAIGNVVAKHAARRHQADAFALVVWSSLVPPIPLAIASYAFEGRAAALGALASAGWLTWASILFMTFGATLWGFSVWNRMLHRYPSAAVTPFALLIPIAGLASTALLLDEPLTLLQAVGAAIVMAGLALAVLAPISRRAPPAAQPAAPLDDRR